MSTADRLALVRDFLASFARLERRATDEAGWIALKLSCSRHEAERLIERATKPAAEPARPLLDELAAALRELLRVDDDWHGAINSEMAGGRKAARAALARYDAERAKPSYDGAFAHDEADGLADWPGNGE